MRYKEHRISGALMGLLIFIIMWPILNIVAGMEENAAITAVITSIGSIIGSQLPDIDHPNSHISRKSSITRCLSILLNRVFGHRGFTHKIYFMIPITLILIFIYIIFISLLSMFMNEVIIPTVINIIYFMFIVGVNIGIFSHLLSDKISLKNMISTKGFFSGKRNKIL